MSYTSFSDFKMSYGLNVSLIFFTLAGMGMPLVRPTKD